MKIITKREILLSLAKRIKDMYQLEGIWYQSSWSKPRYEALSNLPTDAPESDFVEIIGNNAWTNILCSKCQQSVDKVIDFGHCGYEDLTIMLCPDCLDEAKKLLQE